ncbi:ABC transporter ATP-binding protein [Roseburia inulinivorans]|jgi:ABC-type polysaccharide/polyol phosphate transport system ATPase subunit|uniref:ABC transporter ATP-binding protein n=1 Tax=Roseburia inulinivorans TaxID=360807 RepID=A0A3R6A8S4_9FIRM|nr:ABC transporter ATP-binding protein [Roseburia inulinivorans]RGS66751.1 ABC transporter ATP-binding protein [Roseburia inulinivorans]RHF00072.1 ABC transporter ATP-binding protein [Roseburia inulinivorans]
MQEKVIEIKDVTKTYKLYNKPSDRLRENFSITHKNYHRDHDALQGISLDVYKGECIGIIGTNGSGKSTLLKIVTGVVAPTSGTLEIKGKISALLELGAGFNQEYTGIENIYLNGTMVGFTKEEMDGKLQSIIDFADIGEFINQPVKTYSSGMFARLAFAVAINVDPDILIVDEALSVGDIFFQSKCYQKFMDLKEAGKTILFVSHDLGSIIKYCDRSLLIHHGKQIAVGKSSEIVDIYKKILVNQFDEKDVEKLLNKENPEENDNKENSEHEDAADEINETENLQTNELDGIWKNQMLNNSNAVTYGNGVADIIDYAIIDEKGKLNFSISKGSNFSIRMKIQFYQDVKQPIFAYTLKDVKGTEITGTNTMLEKQTIDQVKAGEIVTVNFDQNMCLQSGNYLLALGCTGFENGNFTVYSRLYDVCNLQVVSDHDTVGYVDMGTKVTYL